jgi:hypothetical protein
MMQVFNFIGKPYWPISKLSNCQIILCCVTHLYCINAIEDVAVIPLLTFVNYLIT